MGYLCLKAILSYTTELFKPLKIKILCAGFWLVWFFFQYYLEVHLDLSANLLPGSSLNLLRLKLFSWLQCPLQKRNHQNDSQKEIKAQTVNTGKADRSSIKHSLLTETHPYKQLKTHFQTSRS